MGHNYSLVQELWIFLKAKKAWWLVPILLLLVILSVLIFISQASSVSPFIYALF